MLLEGPPTPLAGPDRPKNKNMESSRTRIIEQTWLWGSGPSDTSTSSPPNTRTRCTLLCIQWIRRNYWFEQNMSRPFTTLLKFPGFSVQSTPKGLHSKKGKIYLRHPGYTLFIWRRSLHCHWHNVLSPEEHQTKNSLLLPFCRLRWLWLQFPIIMDQMVDLKCWGPRWKYLNSSQSPRITFMCLSNALNWPMKVRESLRYRSFILTYWFEQYTLFTTKKRLLLYQYKILNPYLPAEWPSSCNWCGWPSCCSCPQPSCSMTGICKLRLGAIVNQELVNKIVYDCDRHFLGSGYNLLHFPVRWQKKTEMLPYVNVAVVCAATPIPPVSSFVKRRDQWTNLPDTW